MRTDEVHEWTQAYDVTYNGSLGTADMQSSTQRVTVGLKQDGVATYTRTNVSYAYTNEVLLTDEEVQQLQEAGTTFETDFKQNYFTESGRTTSSSVSPKNGMMVHRQNFVDDDETDPNNYAFSMYHTLTYSQIVGSSGGSADLNLSFQAPATRSFTPISKKMNIAEHDFMDVRAYAPEKTMVIQATPDSPRTEQIELKWSCLTLNSVYLAGANTTSISKSLAAIDQAKKGLQVISEQRGIFGASQNRLEHAYKSVANTRENTQASESAIRDTDMAKEYATFSTHNILEQAGQTMLAQANQSKDGVMTLLQ
jgi:flagellin-like hook-associated protein FlgL